MSGAQGRRGLGGAFRQISCPATGPASLSGADPRRPGPSDARGTRTPLRVKSPVGLDEKKNTHRIWGLNLCFHLVSFRICSWSAICFSEVLIPWKISFRWKFPPHLNKKGSLLPRIIDHYFYKVPPHSRVLKPKLNLSFSDIHRGDRAQLPESISSVLRTLLPI